MKASASSRPNTAGPWSRLRVGLFFGVLCLPLAVMLTPSLRGWTGSQAPDFPDWSWRVGDLKRYPSRFQEQFNSALPLRRDLAALSRALYVDGLGVSPVPEAILGTGGWLYYAGPASGRLVDRHVRGRDPWSQQELDLLLRTLLQRTQRFRSIGATYVLVIAPNKESIYPEHLPAWIGRKAGPSRLDQLMTGLETVPEVTVIDLRPGLIADKPSAPLYFKADTHWNARGAHAAYRQVMQVLRSRFPGLAVRSWASFEPRRIEQRDMDIARMIGLGGLSGETEFELNRGACTERHPVPIPVPEALQSRLTAPAFATQCDTPGNVDAVIFHDSFGVALAPMFEASFRSTANFSATAGPNDVVGYGVPEALKANLVLEIIVERALGANPQF